MLTNYGDVFEIWFDGANGGSGYYGGARETRKIDAKTYYDWKNTYKLIRDLQPKIVIWNDGGDRADLRWVGTEEGYVGETNWSLLNATGDVPEAMLRHGVENGDSWVPGEVNTSIRPGWFYHANEDSRVKSLPQLLNIYHSSFGRNGTLLLSYPIDRRGLIHETDEKAALALDKAVKEAFAVNLAAKKKVTASNVRGAAFGADKALDGDKNTYWTTNDQVKTASLTIDFGKPTTFNRFLAQEYIRLGQRVNAFTVEALVNGGWRELARQTTIGYKRILILPTTTAIQLRFTIIDAKSNPVISNVAIYNAPQVLMAPVVTRTKEGEIQIKATDKESVIYYTVDGSTPARNSKTYTAPFGTDGKMSIKAIAYDPNSGKSSPVAAETFDVVHRNWKLIGVADEKANTVIDGDPESAWYQPKDGQLPADLVVDLGKQENVAGFKYLPGQGRSSGIISHYEFAVSSDNQQWSVVSGGEFSNIKNNPL